ncbi:MAG: archaellin/type IV pilin N-terminal domain-containing protein, partial [Nanoarchaeota archaeon]
MLKFLINKKGMSPVVSTALLLVVAVASVGI